MPLDGIFLKNLCKELSSAIGSRIDKISQPARDEFVFSLRGIGFSKRLLACARSGSARLHFTNAEFENPAVPPMLCMLMRKYLTGGKILSISQDGYERIVKIDIQCLDEMGERRELSLIVELIGNQSNIILVNPDGRIIDAVRRSDIESGKRLIQPGARYTPPPKIEKLTLDDPRIADTVFNMREPLQKAVLDTIAGISPLVARELCLGIGDTVACELSDEQKALFIASLSHLTESAERPLPSLLLENGIPKDFSFMPISQYEGAYTQTAAPSLCELLDLFYSERDRAHRLRHSAADVYKTVQNALMRAQKKLSLRLSDKRRCEEREKFRIYGELIKANIGLIERGAEEAIVPNYYDEELKPIKIPLSPALSAAANSAKYFKDYRKLCSAEQTLTALIVESEREIEYLSSVEDVLSRAQTLAEILDIKDELTLAGYIKQQRGKQQKRKKLPLMEYISVDGYKILVGRNNVQNDELTLKIADKSDVWLHTKNIHGSHVIIRTEGTVPPDSTVLQAAELAAYHSSARASSQVPVDYTAVKNVKKPSGAKPGMVIYKTNSTVFVTPKNY